MLTVDAKSNTLPVNVGQIHLRFVSSPTSTRASVGQAQLGTICDGIVTSAPATTSSQPVPGSSTSTFVGKSASLATPACCGLQTFQSKSAISSTSMTPAVCLATLQSHVNALFSATAVYSPPESSATPLKPSSSTHQVKSSPVPMSTTPPSTCVRPKVLAPSPQSSVPSTCPSLSTGIRPVRPNQPLPPVRTSSCPTKAIPGSKQPDEVYEEVPMHEPDLRRQPSRSALKGSKSTGAQSFQQQLEKALNLSQKLAGCHPFPVDSASDAGISASTGLPKSRSGDFGKLTTKLLPAVPPKPKLM